MIRLSAVRSLLLDEVAALPDDDDRTKPAGDRLARARRRAALVVALDGLAILVLFVWRPQATFLDLRATEEGIFTLAVLAVAVHAGYRLAQLQLFSAIGRALASLPTEGGAEPSDESA